MSLSVAEVYMLALRKSMVPILGEAIPTPFDGQIELDGWSWSLTWSDSDDSKSKKNADKSKAKEAKPSTGMDRTRAVKDDEAVVKRIDNILRDGRLTQEQRNKQVLVKLRESQNERRQGAAKDDADADDTDNTNDSPLFFKFTKNVDLATTQLLNCMKTGEVMPRVVVSLYHRSTNAPLTLIITFKKVTLTDYSCEADVSDTMSDMKESWTATFEEVDYVYQNRPGAGGANLVTQGTARVFKMKLKSLF